MIKNSRPQKSNCYDYFGIDYQIVWDIIVSDLDELRKQLENLLKKYKNK
jgi:uncharacterized protein with HEPN domain